MDKFVIKGCEVFLEGRFVSADLEVSGGVVSRVEPGIVPRTAFLFSISIIAVFFPVLLMSMFICESRVFLIRRRLRPARRRPRGAGTRPSAPCRT